jgi:hypothetical protein
VYGRELAATEVVAVLHRKSLGGLALGLDEHDHVGFDPLAEQLELGELGLGPGAALLGFAIDREVEVGQPFGDGLRPGREALAEGSGVVPALGTTAHGEDGDGNDGEERVVGVGGDAPALEVPCPSRACLGECRRPKKSRN